MVFIRASARQQLSGRWVRRRLARKLAIAAGAPVVAGTEAAIDELENAKKTADALGYPVLLKASAGGGAERMRGALIAKPISKQAIQAMLQAKLSAAKQVSKRREVYSEKWGGGAAAHRDPSVGQGPARPHDSLLGERECSIQRRGDQKAIEDVRLR